MGLAPAAEGSASAPPQAASTRARVALVVRRWAFMGGTSWASALSVMAGGGWGLGRNHAKRAPPPLPRIRDHRSAYSCAELDLGARRWDAGPAGYGPTGDRPPTHLPRRAHRGGGGRASLPGGHPACPDRKSVG